MPYSTPVEVQADFKSIDFTAANAKVNTTSVTEFIVEADGLIDGYIGTVYVTPVTAGAGMNLLKLLSRSLVASRIKQIMQVKTDNNKDSDQAVRGVLMSFANVLAVLKDIQSQKAALAGATLLSSSGGFANNNVNNGVCPVIRKDQKQW